MCEMLGADPRDDGYVFDNGEGQKVQMKHTLNMGFPPRSPFTDDVRKNMENLSDLVSANIPGYPRIEISKSSCTFL